MKDDGKKVRATERETRPNPGTQGKLILEGKGLAKRYGHVQALDGVDIRIRGGEILAIVGDNGAGKSTLIKILSGAIQADEGEILLDGEAIVLHNPQAARSRGIETVFQDLALVPNRDVVQNLFLGRELTVGGVVRPVHILRQAEMRRRALDQLAALEIDIPRVRGLAVERLSGGQQQAVAIARAASWASRVLFMDEPTAALGPKQSSAVLRLARQVAASGLGVVMVSHVLPHVLELADRIVVVRHGQKVAEIDTALSKISINEMIGLIVGAEL